MRHGIALAACVGLAPLGCPTPAPAPVRATPSTARADAEVAPPAEAEAPAQDVPMQEVSPGVFIPKKLPNGVPIMTPMDFALLVLDRAELTREQRIDQAYARRKLIMNSPESSTARMLNDLAEAHRKGEIDPLRRDNGVVFGVPGQPPPKGGAPLGTRPERAPRRADLPDASKPPPAGG